MSEVIDTRRMPDGTEYRSRLLPEADAEEPYDDGQWPILRTEWRGYQGRYVATAFNQAATPYVDRFNELANRGHNMEVFERFLRIFHGVTQFHMFGPERTRATDYTYIAFDTRAWREEIGTDAEHVAKEKPLAEIIAWIEGDTWGIVTETRWNPDEDKDEDDWEPLESVWGFYGRKYAEEAAKTELENTVQGHKVVHRYPEHETLVAVETQVRACFELLEYMEGHEDNIRIVRDRPDGVTVTITRPNHQRLIYEAFGIDYDKIEQERELMLQRLQEEANKS